MGKIISRRQLLQLGLSGAALAILNRCAPGTVTGTPDPTREGGTPKVLSNENRPGFYIRYYKPFDAEDRGEWRLDVEGLVENPLSLTYEDIQALPAVSQKSRMKCVEGWSAAAKWTGFTMETLLDEVGARPEATWVHFHCADDYYESLSVEELLEDRVLFVYGMNDELLADEYGAPLRLIVPRLYGYKGAKAITRLVFADEELKGFWPTVGPYTTHGRIAAGSDYALDLDDRRDHPAGEVIYEDGLESTGS